MTSELTWDYPGKVMRLRIAGDYELKDCEQTNSAILLELERSRGSLILVIDATEMNRPFNFEQIRATQTYQYHEKLAYIYVAAIDRVVKLAMLIVFNLSRAHFHLFDDVRRLDVALQNQVKMLG